MDSLKGLAAVLVLIAFATGSASGLLQAPSKSTPAPAYPLGDVLPMKMMADRYADEFYLEPQPDGLDPVAANHYWLEEREMLGRTPMGWVEWAHETFNLDEPAALPPVTQPDLAANVARLYPLVGLPVSAADLAALQTSAASVPQPLQAYFADLVGTVADVYAAQLPVALDLVSKWPHEFDIHEPFMTPEVRDATAARAADLVDAFNLFRARTAGLFDPQPAGTCAGPPLFAEPVEGLVILGSECDNTYTRGGLLLDPILIVDPAGDDDYFTSAGGADPTGILSTGTGVGNKLVVSAVLDALGNDQYIYNGAPAIVQGAAALGGIGLLVDAAGDDQYLSTLTRTTVGPFQPLGQYYFDAGAQGYGYAAVGVLLDGVGNDLYRADVRSLNGRHIWNFAQGFAAAGGLALSSDGAGTDRWLSNGLGITGGTSGFQGVYTQGTGFYAGVGIMTDTGLGDDVYWSWDNSTTTDYYAQGFGAFGGLGIMYEDGGNDNYIAESIATNSWINPLLHCSYGTGSIAGLGVFVDLLGNDRYYGRAASTASGRAAETMNEGFGGIGAAYGVFYDAQGVDQHLMYASTGGGAAITAGRGVWLGGGNIVGNYLDSGGVDTYVGAPGSHDNGVWVAGADLNLVP